MILVNAIKIIFLLGFLIFIHEGGHFLAAKLFKVKVENFSIGFGPKIFTKKGKETEYSISAIPFGGYIKMAGEFEKNDEPGSFNNAKVLHRILIVAAGPMINIIFGILVFFILSVFSGYNLSTTVSEIIPNANPTGIEIGDKILEINGEKIRIKSDITDAVNKSNGEKIKVLVNRNGENIELEVMPTEYNGMYILGEYRQPTFFYESVWCLFGFLAMLIIRQYKYLKIGQLTSFYLIWYGIIRCIIEAMRTDSLMLGPLKMAQLVSLVFIVSGIIIFIKSTKTNQKELYNV